MPLKHTSLTSRRMVLCACALLLLTFGAALFAPQAAWAQPRNPFAIGATEGGVPGGAFGLWLVAEQARLTHAMTTALRGTRTDVAAFWSLAAISFGYGVFHAAGPGHGKAVMASYMVANERALSRGLILTFGAALLQAFVAIALVVVLRFVVGATAMRMTDTARAIEFTSYGVVALLGAWLVWRKGRAFATALAAQLRPTPSLAFAGGGGQSSRFTCEAIDESHMHDASCTHCHAPDPATLGANFSWTGALGAMAAAGARPCSGAIVVLVFALSQDLFWVGIAAALFMALGTALTTGTLAVVAVYAKRIAMRLVGAETGRGILVARGAELAAAVFVLVIGVALLFGSAYAVAIA